MPQDVVTHQPKWPYSPQARLAHYNAPGQDEVMHKNGERIPRPMTTSTAPLLGLSAAQGLTYSASVPRWVPREGMLQCVANEQQCETSGQSSNYASTWKACATPPSSALPYGVADYANLPGPTQASNTQMSSMHSPNPLAVEFEHFVLDAAPSSSSKRNVVRRTRQTPNGELVEYYDQSSQVMTSIQSEPKERITEPALYQQGVRAHRMLQQTPNNSEKLDPGFKRPARPKKFFVLGKVFLICWVEPAADSNQSGLTHATNATSIEISRNHFDEPVFSKVRRFVVIREGELFCTALPVMTYNGQGVAKRGLTKSDHAIIFTGKEPPALDASEAPARGEIGMRQGAIRVDCDMPGAKLDRMSRIDFGKPHTIHHNLKTKSFGKVNRDSMANLLYQFQAVWAIGLDSQTLQPSSAPEGLPTESDRQLGASSDTDIWTDAYSLLLAKGYSMEVVLSFLQEKGKPHLGDQ